MQQKHLINKEVARKTHPLSHTKKNNELGKEQLKISVVFQAASIPKHSRVMR